MIEEENKEISEEEVLSDLRENMKNMLQNGTPTKKQMWESIQSKIWFELDIDTSNEEGVLQKEFSIEWFKQKISQLKVQYHNWLIERKLGKVWTINKPGSRRKEKVHTTNPSLNFARQDMFEYIMNICNIFILIEKDWGGSINAIKNEIKECNNIKEKERWEELLEFTKPVNKSLPVDKQKYLTFADKFRRKKKSKETKS